MIAQTPMLKQYFAAKAEYPGVLIAMRVGDFYEFYGEDADKVSEVLEITLTGKADGSNGRISMAGVPFHSVEKYLARLVQKGYQVGLCDQLEDPKLAKGLVKRGVTRVLTPGTVLEDSLLKPGQNNFLAAVCVRDGKLGLATLDPSTGEFAVTELGGDSATERLIQELARLRPAEVLAMGDDEPTKLAAEAIGSAVGVVAAPTPDRAYRRLLEQFSVTNLQGFGCDDKPVAQVAAAMVLNYAERTKLPLGHVASLTTYSVDGFMRLDLATRRSLELTSNLNDGGKKFTLLDVIDETVTSMGGRLLRRWIDQPLLDIATIELRQDAIECLTRNALARGDLREGLKRIQDLERLVSRVSANLAGPRDLGALRSSLMALPQLAEPLRKVGLGRIQVLREQMFDHSGLARMLDEAIVAEPPHTVRDGGVIRPGFDTELDKLRSLSRDGKGYIAGLEQQEREKTGINTLKVGFNSVFGYYLEVSKSRISEVPDSYIRKQTTANAERYITAELKEHESLVLGAEEKAVSLETDLFGQVRLRVLEETQKLLDTARALAEIDVLAGLAEVAVRRRYCRPVVTEEDRLEIAGGRHAVVEAAGSAFIPNDLRLDDTARVMILTGPNMSGKSTFLRQIALITLMAQMGSFVPAESCLVGLRDRIFARIGAKDELALGQSTFMVEMVESANILNHATARSLVILDEVGRGTSTFDGLAIAWAMVENLQVGGSMTLFSTHYHQLNSLASHLEGVVNFRVSVEEIGDDIVWTHKVVPGGADRSYGIHVARMAGVPGSVLVRATEVLADLEGTQDSVSVQEPVRNKLQLSLFEAETPAVVEALRELDVNHLTPIEALKLLDAWKQIYGKR